MSGSPTRWATVSIAGDRRAILFFWHDRQRPASEKHAAAQRGGLSPRRTALPATIPPAQLASPEECLRLLTDIAQAVQRGEASAKTTTSAGYLVDIARKVWVACIAARKLDKVERLVHGRARQR